MNVMIQNIVILLSALAALPLVTTPAPVDFGWLVQTTTDPMTDKPSSTVALLGDYVAPRDEKPTVGFSCGNGRLIGAALVTGGPMVGPATRELSKMQGWGEGLGLSVVTRFDDDKPRSGQEPMARGLMGFHITGYPRGLYLFASRFIVAQRYRVQFDISPSGSLTAEFYPSRADATKVKALCGLK